MVFIYFLILGFSDIIELTDETIQSTIQNIGVIFIEFYHPRCRYCKAFAPVFEEISQNLQENDSLIQLGAIDATTETDSKEKYKINSYPTLILFKQGVAVDRYTGLRSTQAILQYLSAQEKFASFLNY